MSEPVLISTEQAIKATMMGGTGPLVTEIIGQLDSLIEHSTGSPPDPAAKEQILNEVRDHIFGENGILDTFSKGGEVEDVAERHAEMIKKMGKEPENAASKIVLQKVASNISHYMQNEVPELAKPVSDLMRSR